MRESFDFEFMLKVLLKIKQSKKFNLDIVEYMFAIHISRKKNFLNHYIKEKIKFLINFWPKF